MSEIGVIAIGRNERERLRRCLESACGHGLHVVYVDSNSTDQSVSLAKSIGADVVELDMSVPFSAARARNAGFERLLQLHPQVQLVQFVDGDCEIVAGWIERAAETLGANQDTAVVCGRRRERFSQTSVYNLLADLEWDTPLGQTESCGGDSMMRVNAFAAVKGFDPTVAAGEEPELCQRLRAAGWKILRIDAEMTLHDSAMFSFGQWWRRVVRSGYGSVDVSSRFGSQGLFHFQVRSARMWAIGWPVAIAIAGVISGIVFCWRWGIVVAAIVALAMPAQMVRLAMKIRPRLPRFSDAFGYGILTMVGKFAYLAGEIRYRLDRRAGRNTRLIEYKDAAVSSTAYQGTVT